MLDVSHVRKEFGTVQAVRDVSFSIAAGSTFGLLGPNGAGKTTTMRMILGIYTPDRGTITWNTQRIDHALRRQSFGYLPEERGLYGKMRVREQIAFFARLHGLRENDARKKTDAWIERLALQEYRDLRCSELSKGNQQKVQIACAAVHEPQLLILDEPFSGLDPVNAQMLLGALHWLKKQGTTLVLSSHQMWQLEELCEAFCIITGGENRAAGTLAQLRAAWQTRVIKVEPASNAAIGVFERLGCARRLRSDDGALLFEVPSDTQMPQLLRTLVNVDAITRFEALEPTLQDIYLRAIGASAERPAL